MKADLKVLWLPEKAEEELDVVIRSIGEKEENDTENYETNIEITKAIAIL
jgi:hypothetical protein